MDFTRWSVVLLFLTYTTVIAFSNGKLLKDERDCPFDKLCKINKGTEELDTLECAQQHKVSEFTLICLNIIREHAVNFFKESFIRRLLIAQCGDDIRSAKCDGRNFLFCILENKDKISDYYCLHIIQRVEYLMTANFSLVSDYKRICETDYSRIKCAKRKADSESVLDDNGVLDCLQKSIDSINDTTCRKEVLYLSEIQGENMKSDNALLLACTMDRHRFCKDLRSDTEEDLLTVYKCLQEYSSHPEMTPQCHEQLLKREKLVSKDLKISKGLVRACREDIRAHRCRRMISDNKGIRLAQMLLCLENAAHNGSRISNDCRSEMVRHRKFLMEDYRLSPEVVSRCANDIEDFCTGLGIGGKTIHCLLEHSRSKRRRQNTVSLVCQRALWNLLKVADAGEDWRVDPVLRYACESTVRNLCNDARGEQVKVMSCLMDNINSNMMKKECERALLQIQYFVARDFKLDPQLFSACHDDATKMCHAESAWSNDVLGNSVDSQYGSLVLPCLYRYAYNTKSNKSSYKLKVECEEEVRRVMRQRAVKVELIPEVEESCIDDLANYCTEKTGPGEEMLCLQDRYTKLKPNCKLAVGNFTEVEVIDINLNPIVKAHCRSVISTYCKDEISMKTDVDVDDVMECLIRHKNDADVRIKYKCRAAIEHFQLISLSDYRFTVAFKEACRPYVIRYCPKAHTKAQVIECLSEVTQNDTIKDEKYKLSKECRYQLRGQLLQQREFIELDPRLKTACENDISIFCKKPDHKSFQVLECLMENKKSLSLQCHKVIFRIERHDFTDSSTDYTLLFTCKQMIKEYCKDVDTSQALVCLKKFKDHQMFDSNCKSLVMKRMVEQNADYRLNPALQRGCSQDILKFCSPILQSHKSDVEFEGKILYCLKVKFRERKLRKECEKELSVVLKESALNYKLNPLLRSLCTNSIRDLCSSEVRLEENDNSGRVEECLKEAFLDGRIADRACRIEVAGLIEEAKADIHVDPILSRACSIDINKFCIDVPHGAGRVLQCLQSVITSNKQKLQTDCEFKLSQRIEMFRNAEPLVNEEPKDLRELISHVSRSPSKKYFVASFFSIVGLIFMLGLFCGRVTRRSAMLKNK